MTTVLRRNLCPDLWIFHVSVYQTLQQNDEGENPTEKREVIQVNEVNIAVCKIKGIVKENVYLHT